jgi:uncharacterized membrane-anchored protein
MHLSVLRLRLARRQALVKHLLLEDNLVGACAWATRWQDALRQRVSSMGNLLRTRAKIEQHQSSQALLSTRNRRQDLQLKLQSTVEGLSVAAITYDIVGLVAYLAKGLHKGRLALQAGSPYRPAVRVRLLGSNSVDAAIAAAAAMTMVELVSKGLGSDSFGIL